MFPYDCCWNADGIICDVGDMIVLWKLLPLLMLLLLLIGDGKFIANDDSGLVAIGIAECTGLE
jgi:hypothetical protein